MKNILLHRAYPGAFAAFAFLLIAPDTVQAQTPKQFFACYVPSSGVVYRIKEDGLKNACTGEKHVEFSWAQLLADVDGKVGIGTENPTVALDVVGDIRASGNLIIGNTIEINDVTNSITSTSGALSFGDENLATTGTVTAAAFVGDGSQLTNLTSGGAVTLETTNAIRLNVLVSAGTTLSISDLSCPSGWFATGSGWDFDITASIPEPKWLQNQPAGDAGWLFTIENENGALNLVVDVYIRCVRLVM